MGEALTADGQIELAIKNYERSVELNPQSAGGKKTLDGLRSKKHNS